ncbi:hypothetical protein [Sedimentitalea nanhaiensis]|nr:hypothetical protein [Sedimentitalea nanhaiensis]
MNRRDLLAAAPAVAVAGTANALPLTAESGDTPIMRLFREHQAITDAARKHESKAIGKAEDEGLDRLFHVRTDRIEDEMMSLPQLPLLTSREDNCRHRLRRMCSRLGYPSSLAGGPRI